VADLNLDALAPNDHSVIIDGTKYVVPAEIAIPRVVESVKLRRQLMEAEAQVRHLAIENSTLQADYIALSEEEEQAGEDEEKRKAVAAKLGDIDERFSKLEREFGEAEESVDSSLTALYNCAMGFLRMRDPEIPDLNLTPRHTMAILGLVAGAEDGGVAVAVADALGGGVDPTKDQPKAKPERTMSVPKTRKPRAAPSSRSKKASPAQS
jgi:hypothetical protein